MTYERKTTDADLNRASGRGPIWPVFCSLRDDLVACEQALAAAERERDVYKALAEGLDNLCAAYRTARAPAEATLNKIHKARVDIDAARAEEQR